MADQRWLSRYFQSWEFVRSSRAVELGIANVPTDAQFRSMVRLCDTVMDPVREEFGSWFVSSGFRCVALNEAVDGYRKSAHPFGCACDGRAYDPRVALVDVMRWFQGPGAKLPYDQVIYEYGRWIHIGIRRPGYSGPRRQLLMKFESQRAVPFDLGGLTV